MPLPSILRDITEDEIQLRSAESQQVTFCW